MQLREKGLQQVTSACMVGQKLLLSFVNKGQLALLTSALEYSWFSPLLSGESIFSIVDLSTAEPKKAMIPSRPGAYLTHCPANSLVGGLSLGWSV